MIKLKLTKRKLVIYSFVVLAFSAFLLQTEQKKRSKKSKARPTEVSTLSKTEAIDRQNRYNYLIQSAQELYDNQNFAEALTKFEQALTLVPNDSQATRMVEKSRNAIEMQKEIENLRNQEEGKKNRLAKISKLEAKGIALFNQQNYAEAKSAFTELKSLDPTNSEANKYLAMINELTSKGYRERLKSSKVEAVVDEQLALAQEYYNAGQLYKAIVELKKLRSYPEVKQSTYKIRIDSVITSYEAALENQLEGKLQNAQAMRENNDFVKARELLREILNTYPDYKAAKKEYENLLAELNKLAFAAYNEGRVFEASDDVDEAIKSFEQVLELLEPKDEYYKKAAAQLARLKK